MAAPGYLRRIEATLAQLGHWLGERDFLAGVNRHLTTHAFGNADLADFLERYPEIVLDRADKALYFAKQNGRDAVHGYESLKARGELASSVALGSIDLF